MNELFKTLSATAGLAGISVGFVLVIFRDVIRKNIFPKLESQHAYLLLRQIIFLTSCVGVLGIVAWGIDRSNLVTRVVAELSSAPADSGPHQVPSAPSRAADSVQKQQSIQSDDDVILERTRAIIAHELEIPIDQIKPETNLYTSGSFNMISLVVDLSDAFNIYIPDEDSFRFRTVKDVTDYVQKKMRLRPRQPHTPQPTHGK